MTDVRVGGLDARLGPWPEYDGKVITTPLRRVVVLYIVGLALGFAGGFAFASILWGLSFV